MYFYQVLNTGGPLFLNFVWTCLTDFVLTEGTQAKLVTGRRGGGVQQRHAMGGVQAPNTPNVSSTEC